MKKKSIFRHIEIVFIISLIIIFFTYNFKRISYGLPYFWDPDEIEFQASVLSSIFFLTDFFELQYNPLYASLLNSIIILKSIFINDLLINSLTLDEIKSKLYFNPEIFLFYGRLASLTITSCSFFILFKISKKLKLNFLIYSILLITFMSSIVSLNLSTIMGKNSSNLLIYLIQLYVFIKYLLKINKFDYKSYLIFGVLASLAWGVNYWPAFISIYAVFFLHYKKFKFLNIKYLLTFIIIFILFGPILNLFFVIDSPIGYISYAKDLERLESVEISFFYESILNRFLTSLKIIYITDKNILLLVLIAPIFLLNKNVNFKKEFLILLALIIVPLIIFGLAGDFHPQLRFFGGIICVILILSALVFKELYKTKFKYLVILFVTLNFLIIYENITKHLKINNLILKNHTFLNFNQNIKIDRSKIFYLVDLSFQESLRQNLYYLKLYENDLIIKNEGSKKFVEHVKKKIIKIKNTKNIAIDKKNLKENIIYFNYTVFPIKDLNLFFDFIGKDFDYVLIEESKPNYLSNSKLQKKIRSYVKENFLLKSILYDKEKIHLRYRQSVIHYLNNTISEYDEVKNIYNDKLEITYGPNYSLYKLK